jgi:hypothetical protein
MVVGTLTGERRAMRHCGDEAYRVAGSEEVPTASQALIPYPQHRDETRPDSSIDSSSSRTPEN